MKKIGVDARLITKTGVGVYTKNLLRELEKILPQDWTLYAYLLANDYDKISFSRKNIIKKASNYLWHSIDEQLYFPRLLSKDNLDLMHFTYFSYPILYKKPFAITIHDLTHLEHQTGKASTKNSFNYFIKRQGLKLVLHSAIAKSAAVITPTRVVKKQIIDKYGEKVVSKIQVISEGVNEELIKSTENKELKKKFGEDFFLYVGNFYPHKNLERVIDAFSQIKANTKLILVGPKDLFAERIEKCIAKKYSEKRINMYNNPALSDLVFFYKNARALVHPSLNEGFCLPLLEASYFHLPIVASSIPVFKEVIGDEYISFDPQDTDDMQRAVTQAVKKKPVFDYEKILAPYSFRKMAKETLNLYKKILETPGLSF